MPTFTFDATCASQTATSYATVDEADSYVGLYYPESGWLSMEGEPEEITEQKQALLVGATKLIDSLPIDGKPLMDYITPYPQSLKFPLLGHPVISAIVESATTTEIYPSGLRYRAEVTSESLVGGSVLVYSGNLKGEIRRIVAFDQEAQKITCEAFSQAPETGAFMFIIFPVPRAVVAACCEQARHLIDGLGIQAAELALAGISSLNTDDGSVNLSAKGIEAALSPVAAAQLRPYVRSSLNIGRG